jgi:hypothetical protein
MELSGPELSGPELSGPMAHLAQLSGPMAHRAQGSRQEVRPPGALLEGCAERLHGWRIDGREHSTAVTVEIDRGLQ